MNDLTLFLLYIFGTKFKPMKNLLLKSIIICYALSAVVICDTYAADPADSLKTSRNQFKFNLTSAMIKNYSFQYERVLSRNVSAALAYRIMPETGVPWADCIIDRADITDRDEIDLIDNVRLTNYAITPEIRFYTGKKRYGSGFYIALFYRYGHYEAENAIFKYEPDADIKAEEIKLTASGNVSSHTGGFMLGSQWAIGKHLCLDWWILGPQFGVSSGEITGMPSVPLSTEEQKDIRDELNDIDIPMFDQTVEVTANNVSMIFDGPWAGIRAGLSLGIRF
jgi:hypothetical protein